MKLFYDDDADVDGKRKEMSTIDFAVSINQSEVKGSFSRFLFFYSTYFYALLINSSPPSSSSSSRLIERRNDEKRNQHVSVWCRTQTRTSLPCDCLKIRFCVIFGGCPPNITKTPSAIQNKTTDTASLILHNGKGVLDGFDVI